MENKLAQIFVILLLCTLFPPTDSKRGGGVFSGGGRSRGTSGSRMSSGGMSRGTHFGGSSGHKSHNTGGGYYPQGNNAYHRNTNYGHKQPIGSYNPGTNYKQNPGTNWGHGHHNTGFGSGGYHKPHYSKSGVGSFVRSNQFKNMIVGAAAGYLTYQAGKAIIRAAAGPMMWNNRPYYWGQQYYRPSGGASNMCRMPIDSGDQQFGNVHFQDQTRPREIVWGCGWNEVCCGYECCPRHSGYGSGWFGSSSGFSGGVGLSTGYALLAIFVARHYLV
ncbi:hypothetical protein WR25_21209 isoform A [Diploscapter pachys]|uniref:CX domain-containing protein n=2 Tax=Diploscapter pachys TaxID=2018661 RepID=A0A2A2KXM0_9BILA|nr:hypothetical protein WR25_21209 isoform A [Diploscapter pachys]